MRNILIVGALSDIAQATARLWAVRGDRLFLLARDHERLLLLANDLKLRGAPYVDTAVFDACALSSHHQQLDDIIRAMGSIDIVLIAHGSLPDQAACEQDADLALREFTTNGVSVIAMLTLIANIMEHQRAGIIAVISSVAGDRGRQSNYVYGAAKGAVSIFLQGLRNRLSRHHVHVVTIKPGFVDTAMTQHLKKGVLWVSPEVVAKGIVCAIDKKKNVVYLPWFWRFIMLVIAHIPENIFKKMRL